MRPAGFTRIESRAGLWTRLRRLLPGRRYDAGPLAGRLPDGDAFWAAVEERRDAVARALYARYPLTPRSYVARYFLTFARQNRGNPRALLYLDAELGAPGRGVALLEALESGGVTVAGARCLDIGCANGALLLAAAARGASRVVGVEISEGRLRSAGRLTKGTHVEFLAMDIARDDLPGGFGPFDVVFCIDTLEHVSSAEATLAAIGKHLAAGPRSRAFVSVFNPRHPSNVSAEPHYGVPAMVLLPRDDARDLWNDVRGAFGSSLEYEVSDWVPYRELAGILRRVGLASSLFVDSHPALDRSRPFWAGFRERIDELEARVAAGIDGLRTRPALRELLRARLRRYCAGYLQDHEDLASTADAPDAALLDFYMDYYAQPIQVVLRHEQSRPS